MGRKEEVSVALLEAVTAGLLESREPNTPAATRCISEPVLRRLLASLRDAAGKTRPSATVLIGHLTRAQVIHALSVTRESAKGPAEVYVIGPDTAASPDPMEILRAAVPDGVACYFTAISHYSLTTQHPPYHHIARVRASRSSHRTSDGRSRRDEAPTGPTSSAASHDPLGTRLLSLDGLRFYVTNRDARWMPGIKSKFLHPTACVRITSLAQTLVDTLHRPLSCGGPSVIFEAWATAVDTDRLDVDALVRIVTDIDDDRVARRVGYMLDAHNIEIGPNLRALVDSVVRQASPEPIPLFPGYAGDRLATRWHVLTP